MKKYLLIFISLTMIGDAHASRFVGVCTLNAPNGHEQKTEATKTLFNRMGVEDTRLREHLAIYVEWFPREGDSPEGYYYHSNYIKKGSIYPVKVVENVSNVRQIVENILYDSRYEAGQNEKLTNRVLNSSTFFVHENVFSSPNLIALGNFKAINIVNEKGKIRRVEKKRKENGCVIEFENPCKDKLGSPLRYMHCRSELGEWNLDSIAKGLIEAMGSVFDCTVSKKFEF